MAGKRYEYDLEINADAQGLDDAEREIDRIAEALEGTGDAARDALTVLGAMADDMEANLRGTASAADALKAALGDAFSGDSARVEKMVTDLRAMGLTFDEIEANAKEFADVIQRVDGIKLDAINSGLTNVDGALGRVRDSGDQSRSVLANLAGNAAQDLGELGGVVGTLGVGIGQLAEYAVDGNIALSNLAKVAGPMAALTGGLALVNRLVGERAKQQAIDAERTRDWTAAVEEAGAGIDAIIGRLEEADDLVAQLSGGDAFGFEDWLFGRDPVDVIDALNGISVTAQDLAGTFEELRTTTGAMSEDEFLAAAPIQDFAAALLDANLAGVDAQAVIALLHDEYTAYVDAVEEAGRRTEFTAVSLQNINDVMREMTNEQAAVDEAWNILVTDLADGTLNAHNAATAWNTLREELGLSNEEIAEQLNQRLDEKLEEEASAAEDAAEAQREHAEALAEMGVALVEVADGLDEVADRGDAMAGVLSTLSEVGELGQSQELIGFVDGLQALGDAVTELANTGGLAGLDLVPDTWDEVLNMPAELGPVVDAIAGFADSVQTEMAQAFDTGGAAGVEQWAADTRQAITDTLTAAGVESQEQIDQVLSALGLLPDQVAVAIVISNEERARNVLDGMASAIDGLPTDVQLRIAAVAETDPVAALQLAISELEAQGVEVPVELVALLDELTGQVESYEPDPVEVPVEAKANTDDADRDLEKVAEQREAPFSINIVQYVVALALMAALAEPRTANITANALTAEANIELNNLTRARSAPVDAFLRDLPSRQDIINRVTGGQGYIRIPIDTYVRNSARLNGSRAE